MNCDIYQTNCKTYVLVNLELRWMGQDLILPIEPDGAPLFLYHPGCNLKIRPTLPAKAGQLADSAGGE